MPSVQICLDPRASSVLPVQSSESFVHSKLLLRLPHSPVRFFRLLLCYPPFVDRATTPCRWLNPVVNGGEIAALGPKRRLWPVRGGSSAHGADLHFIMPYRSCSQSIEPSGLLGLLSRLLDILVPSPWIQRWDRGLDHGTSQIPTTIQSDKFFRHLA